MMSCHSRSFFRRLYTAPFVSRVLDLARVALRTPDAMFTPLAHGPASAPVLTSGSTRRRSLGRFACLPSRLHRITVSKDHPDVKPVASAN